MLGAVNVVFVAVFLPETNKRGAVTHARFNVWKGARNIALAARDVEMRPLYIASFLYLFGFGFLPPFYGVFLVNQWGFNEAQVGMAFAAVGVCVSFAQLVVLRMLTRRYNERQILRVSLALVAISMVTFSFMPSVALVIAMIPFTSIPQGLSMANMAALISRAAPADRQGVAMGINGSLMALGSALAPAIGGAASAAANIHMPFVLGGICIGAAWVVLFLVAIPRRAASLPAE